MSINVGELVATMRLDDGAFTQGLNRAPERARDALGRFVKQSGEAGEDAGQAMAKGAEKGVERSRTGISRIGHEIGEEFSGTIKKMLTGAAIIAGGKMLLNYFVSAKDAASDLNETVSKAGTIFGNNFGKIDEWSKTAATSLGLSRSAALGAAASFGDMFLQLGIAEDQAADMSTQVVQMAADFGSFNNLPTADVIDSIKGAMNGEYDSLQQMIPTINAAKVEHEALAASGKSSAAELTGAEKAQAVLSIAMTDGARAMGDYGRTADGTANTEKTLGALWEESSAALGQKLLPAWDAFLGILKIGIGLIEPIAGAIEGLIKWVLDLPGPLIVAAAALAGWSLFGTVATLVTTFAASLGTAALAVKGFMASIGPIGILIVGVTTAMAFLMDTADDTQAVIDANTARWERLKGTLNATTGAITEATRAQLAQEAQSSGLLTTLKELGVNTEAYIGASLGAAGGADALAVSVADAEKSVLAQSEAYAAFAEKVPSAVVSQKDFIDAMQSGDFSAVEDSVKAYGESVARSSGDVNAATGIQDLFRAATDQTAGPLSTLSGVMEMAGQDADNFAAAGGAAADVAEAVGDKAGGSVDSMTSLADATKEMEGAASGADVATQFLTAALVAMDGGTLSAEAATRLFEASIRGITSAHLDQQAAADGVTAAQVNLSEAERGLTEAQATLQKAQDEGTASADELAAMSDAVTSAQLAVTDAQRGTTDATLKTKDADDKFTEAQLKARDGAVALAGQAWDTAYAHGGLQAATDAVFDATEKARGEFIKASMDAGEEKSAAHALADQLFGVPGEVPTKFIQNGMDDAISKASALNGVLDKLNNRQVRYQVVGDQVLQFEYGYTPADLHAEGGLIKGPGTDTSDSIPARLSNDEYVVRANMSRKYRGVLNAINANAYAAGGVVGAKSYPVSLVNDAMETPMRREGSPLGKLPVPPTPAYNGSAGVEQWRSLALAALAATGESASWVNAMLQQMQTESGGNPNALNTTDINAVNGVPSGGLLQVIQPTFEGALRGTPWANLISKGRFDPWANLIAAILYTRRAYGSLAKWNQSFSGPNPYDNGGEWPNNTLGVNRSGQSEFVLTGPMAKAMGLLGGGKPDVLASSVLARGDRAMAPAALSNTGVGSAHRVVEFTGPVNVGSFNDAAQLVNHALYLGV